MAADSAPGCLVDRLNSALDRLELALEAVGGRLAEADAAASVVRAMADDRSTLAHELDAARARLARLEAAAKEADAEVAAAARDARDALSEEGAF